MSKQIFAQKVIIEDYHFTDKKNISIEQKINNQKLQNELNLQIIPSFSFENYKKSEEEKMFIKKLKKHFSKVKKYKTFSLEEFKKIKFLNEN